MGFNAWFKSKTADKVLTPLRDALIEQFEPGSRVLEVGCGTGHLLFRACEKISLGVGIDIDQDMIDFANKQKNEAGVSNVQFFNSRIENIQDHTSVGFDVCTATLCLHEIDYDTAVQTLKAMAKLSRRVLVADFMAAKSFGGKLGIELDEFISGHYSRFRVYRRNGYFPGLASTAGLDITSTIETSMDGVGIWMLNGVAES